MKRIINKCPDCGSMEIDTFRMTTGPIWCNECGYKVEYKENCNPFFTEIITDDCEIFGPFIVEMKIRK